MSIMTTVWRRVSNMSSLSVGAKILGIVGICLMLLLAVAGIGIWQMSKIGHEITEIAERDIPLTQALTKVTEHQLEQAISLERALRASGMKMDAATSARIMAETVGRFRELSTTVEHELEVAQEIAAAAGASADTEEARAMFGEVEHELQAIAAEHRDFDAHSLEALEHVQSGDYGAAIALLPEIEAEEGELIHALEVALEKVAEFTARAANAAEDHEKFALNLLLAVSLVALVGGFLLALVLAKRSISRPLAQIVAGLDALAAGDLSHELSVRSSDEIGQVAKAYETFKETMARARALEAEQAEMQEQMERQQRQAMLELANRFEASVGDIVMTVSGASTELSTTAGSMAGIAEKTNHQASSAASAAEQASANVQLAIAA